MTFSRRLIAALIFFGCITSIDGTELYKCRVDGATVYQDLPCDADADHEEVMEMPGRPSGRAEPVVSTGPGSNVSGDFVESTASMFESGDADKTPFSVPLSEIEQRINQDPSADGIEMTIEADGGVLRLDIKKMPGEISIAAVIRVIMMIGRLAEPGYSEMRFSDEGTDIFVMQGEKIREIGQQFVWGEAGKGQNPIHLMRLFADGLRTATGERVAPPMTGALLGDTTNAVTTINKRFHPEWTMRTLEIL